MKLPVEVTVIIDVPLIPGFVLTMLGLAESEKSGEPEKTTWIVIV